MRHSILLLFLCVILNSTINAQGYDVKFSEVIELDGRKSGYVYDIVAEDDLYLFVLMTERPRSVSNSKQLFIQSIDKKNLKPAYKQAIYETPEEKKLFPFRSMFSNKDGIVVFFESEGKNENIIYAMTLDFDLKLAHEKKAIYTYNPKEETTRLIQRKNSNEFALMSQKYVDEGEPIEVNYTIYDNKFFRVHSSAIQLELYSKISANKAKKKGASILGNFIYTEGGEIISLTWVSPKSGGRGHYELNFVNANTGESEAIPIKLEQNAYFDDHKLIVSGDELILAGFYSDQIEKDKLLSSKTYKTSNFNINGTFFQRYRISDRMLLQFSQTPFDQEFMNYITHNNPGIHASSKLGELLVGSPAELDQDDISGNYRIRTVVYDNEKKQATFYCEYARNYETTERNTTSSGSYTRVNYHSHRGNLFYYNISLKDGTMNWFNSIRRRIHLTSGSSSIYYVSTFDVFPRRGGDLILYQTQYRFDENNPSDMRGVKMDQNAFEQPFFSALIDDKNGEYENYIPPIATTRVPEHMKIQYENAFRSSYNDKFYTLNVKYKLIPWIFPVAFVAAYIPFVYVKSSSQVYTIAEIDLAR